MGDFRGGREDWRWEANQGEGLGNQGVYHLVLGWGRTANQGVHHLVLGWGRTANQGGPSSHKLGNVPAN